ncbi:MAG: hypothetical protein ACREQN_09705 [Candidatus Binataceae bacterium]
MMRCPSCSRVQEPRLTCAECGAPLGVELDFFAALGLPRRLVIDTSLLEQAYHQLGRRIHPDRFATAAAPIRKASLRSTALLTRGYRTLREPISRGLYWLELHGHKLADNNKSVPPELAELVFEVQEQLAELRDARESGGDEARELATAIGERRARLQAAIDGAQDELERNFTRWDAGDDEKNGDRLTVELKADLSKIAYLRTLIRDVDRELETAKAA